MQFLFPLLQIYYAKKKADKQRHKHAAPATTTEETTNIHTAAVAQTSHASTSQRKSHNVTGGAHMNNIIISNKYETGLNNDGFDDDQCDYIVKPNEVLLQNCQIRLVFAMPFSSFVFIVICIVASVTPILFFDTESWAPSSPSKHSNFLKLFFFSWHCPKVMTCRPIWQRQTYSIFVLKLVKLLCTS